METRASSQKQRERSCRAAGACSLFPTWPVNALLSPLQKLAGRSSGCRWRLRAVVDALALSAVAIAELLPKPRAWRATGGGCRNPAWLQATCDALGARVEVTEHAGEAVGPAVLALRSLGLDPQIGIAATVEPKEERTRQYARLYGRYRELDDRLREL
jgi:sugar (pentulose or hexulose) kinase